ncbi:unnamed protein product [Paramecium sonneborni]|uniref:Uncharacterized protein n=1 Tax=Paramecium sonneborni TaxID=65129 RepID=A0A8S1RT28_9CILI|nr:unnamed protein product [Paramecium sonneborni]
MICQKKLNYDLFFTEPEYTSIRSVGLQQLKEGDRYLLDEVHVNEIILIIQVYVQEFCQQQFDKFQNNLRKEIAEFWNSKKSKVQLNFWIYDLQHEQDKGAFYLEVYSAQKLISNYKNQTQIQQHRCKQMMGKIRFEKEDQEVVCMSIKQFISMLILFNFTKIIKLKSSANMEKFKMKKTSELPLEMTYRELPLVNYQKNRKLRLYQDNSSIDNNHSWMDNYFDDSNEKNNKKTSKKRLFIKLERQHIFIYAQIYSGIFCIFILDRFQ